MGRTRGKREAPYEQLLEEERLILVAAELLLELMEREDVKKSELAARIGRSKGFISQLLTGERNLTLRTFAALTYSLGHRLELSAVPIAGAEAESQQPETRVIQARHSGAIRRPCALYPTRAATPRDVVRPGEVPRTADPSESLVAA